MTTETTDEVLGTNELSLKQIADAIAVERAKRLTGQLLTPYLFNRKLRRQAYKKAARDFVPAIKAAANREMRQSWQDFEDRVAIKVAMRAATRGA